MFGRLKTDKTAGAQSIDGMRDVRMPEAGAVVLDANDLPWLDDSEDTTLTKQLDTEKKQALAQQNKIIAFFSIDASNLVTPEEIVGLGSRGLRDLKRERLRELQRMTLETDDPQVTPEQRAKFLRKLAKNEITKADEASFLLLVRDPFNDPNIGAEKMFERLALDPRQVQILAVATGYNLKNWQKIDKGALERLLGAVQANGGDYRTPVGFEKLKKHFLNGIKAKAKPQVYQCYKQSMKELEKTLYGQRWEFARQFEVLRKEAKKQEVTMGGDDTEVEVVQKMPSKTSLLKIAEEGFSRLISERSSEMLNRVVIEGDAWRGNGKDEYLSAHDLVQAKLSPMYEVKVGKEKVYLSVLFPLLDGQIGVLAYVPEGQSFKVRAYYRSNAIGLWCYMPDYVRKPDGTFGRYGMGYGKESVILPFELQRALFQIERKFGTAKIETAISIFARTAKAYDTVPEYQALSRQDKMRGDFYQEVSQEAFNHDLGTLEHRRKKAPYTLGIDYRKAPDFKQRKVHFKTETADVGEVSVEGFGSHDGQLIWLFGSDSKKRTWIMHVELISPLTSLGLRRDWLDMGDFMTPLYEYTSRAGIYGDRNDTRGARQCMWNNYLSNIPLIREYVARLRG